MATTGRKTEKEMLTTGERWAGLSIIAAMLLLWAYFAYHQWTGTGFFTAEFGSLEMLALYGPIVVSFAAPIVRAVTGRRNPARPLDAAMHLSLAVGSLWLLIVFPFEFSHLADALPEGIRFLLAWVTNGIGKIPLILQVILGPISALAALWKYVSVRSHEPAGPPQVLTS